MLAFLWDRPQQHLVMHLVDVRLTYVSMLLSRCRLNGCGTFLTR